MMLHEVLRDVMHLLTEHTLLQPITIARAGEHAYQTRFEPDKSRKRGWRSEGRRWMDGSETTPTRGTKHGYTGWAMWSTHLGWQVEAILADDWRILDLDPAIAATLARRRQESARAVLAMLDERVKAGSVFADAGPDRTIRPALDSSAVCPRCKLRDELVRATNYGRDTGRLHCRRCNLTLDPEGGS
jgi:hypothetical protein